VVETVKEASAKPIRTESPTEGGQVGKAPPVAGSIAANSTAGASDAPDYKGQDHRHTMKSRSKVIHQDVGTRRAGRNTTSRDIHSSYNF
jgi:hypothetical protein